MSAPGEAGALTCPVLAGERVVIGKPDLAARPSRQAVDRLAVRALVSLDRVALLTQAGQGGARGVRQPAGCLHHGGEARAGLALHERDDLGLLGAGARLSRGLMLAESVLLRLTPLGRRSLR